MNPQANSGFPFEKPQTISPPSIPPHAEVPFQLVLDAVESPVPTEKITVPMEKITVPTQKITVPMEKITVPTEKITVPTEKITVPTEKITVPMEKITVPMEKITVPTEKITVPMEKITDRKERISEDFLAVRKRFSCATVEKPLSHKDLNAPRVLISAFCFPNFSSTQDRSMFRS